MTDEQLTQTMHASMPLTQTLGVEALAAAAEEVRARLPWRPELCTAGGLMHGGALMALADSAGGFCAFLNLPEGAKGTATIESKTNMLRGLTEGSRDALMAFRGSGPDDDSAARIVGMHVHDYAVTPS